MYWLNCCTWFSGVGRVRITETASFFFSFFVLLSDFSLHSLVIMYWGEIIKQKVLNDRFLLCRARKSKTHVSLVPRVLARKEAGQEGEGPERGEGKKLSNEDFRKLLMKK